MSSSTDGSLLREAPDISSALLVKKSKGKGSEGGYSTSSSTKSLHENDDKVLEVNSIGISSSSVNLSEVETGLDTYLEKLEAIHWENSSSSVANVLGQMLSSVNNLSSSLGAQFDSSSPEHLDLQEEIQSELNQIGELFSDYAERHPSICQDQAAAAAVFEQLQAAASIRQLQPSPNNRKKPKK